MVMADVLIYGAIMNGSMQQVIWEYVMLYGTQNNTQTFNPPKYDSHVTEQHICHNNLPLPPSGWYSELLNEALFLLVFPKISLPQPFRSHTTTHTLGWVQVLLNEWATSLSFTQPFFSIRRLLFFSLFFISLLPFFTLLLRQLIMEDNKAPEVPMPCTAGCGFYGNKIYNNMCSKCFREQAEQNKQRKRLISMYMWTSTHLFYLQWSINSYFRCQASTIIYTYQ